MQTKRIAIIIIFIATINCYFFALMTKREPIAFEYAFECGYSHYDPIATNFQDRFGDGQGHLISFGAPIESIEYNPLYIYSTRMNLGLTMLYYFRQSPYFISSIL